MIEPNEILSILTKHLKKTETTLVDIKTCSSNWPSLPSDLPEQKANINLEKYRQTFETLGVLLSPDECSTFQQIIEIRKKLEKAKFEFCSAMEKKKIVGAQECLNKANVYKELLEKQRTLEFPFAETILHKWRTALIALEADLHSK